MLKFILENDRIDVQFIEAIDSFEAGNSPFTGHLVANNSKFIQKTVERFKYT